MTLKLWEVSTARCVRTLEGHTNPVKLACLSGDGRWALSGSKDTTLRLWELDWEYEFPGWSDWDEGARSHLVNFLASCSPPPVSGIWRVLTPRGKPSWDDEDFKQLLHTLGCAGYGWLRPEGVKRELEKMAADWQGPPPLV
jgi:WD40 repeat protein